MNRAGTEILIVVALIVSVLAHLVIMEAVQPKVMTHVVSENVRGERRVSMRVSKEAPKPAPAHIDAVADLAAKKDAPPAVEAAHAPAAFAAPVQAAQAVLPPEVPAPLPVREMFDTSFDVKPISFADSKASYSIPMGKIEMPRASGEVLAAPEARKPLVSDGRAALPTPAAQPAVPATGPNPDSVFLPVKMKVASEGEKKSGAAFRPAQEVYAKVDEKIVEDEKRAVRKLLEPTETEPHELERAVTVDLAKTEAKDGFTYFRVTVAPRKDLPIVPKDVVIAIDGSGSIGNDRLGSCRKAARRILRTCTNSGDRFNLVVFRNAFSYAFRAWQPCNAASFEAGERWLGAQTAHGRTDVFSTISSVLTLPRDPARPLVALIVTDGDANVGVRDTSEILAKFTALNEGLVSVYMYGVKSSANRELIDLLTHGNRGAGFVFDGWRWNAGDGIDALSEQFRDPVLNDLRVVFTSACRAETYPRYLRNLYRGATLDIVGRVPAGVKEVAFSVRGLNGRDVHEGFFRLPLGTATVDDNLPAAFAAERAIDARLR